MLKYTVLALALITLASCHERRRHRIEDPLTVLDRHLTQTLAHRYLWPWSQLLQAAAAVADDEESLEEPQIESDKNMYRVHMNVKRFKPDELSVKVKNRYIIVEGRHKENNDFKQFIANHFMQRLALPLGSKPEEVTAVLNENNVLTVTVPKHELPPPPLEIEVPIEVRLSESSSATPETSSEKAIETSSEKAIETSSEKAIETSSEKAIETSSEKSIEVSSAKPIESSSTKPVDTSTETVKESSSAKPIQSWPKKYLVSTTAMPLVQLDLGTSTTHLGKIRKKELKNTIKTAKDNEVTKGDDNNGLDYFLVESELE